MLHLFLPDGKKSGFKILFHSSSTIFKINTRTLFGFTIDLGNLVIFQLLILFNLYISSIDLIVPSGININPLIARVLKNYVSCCDINQGFIAAFL